MLSLIRGKFMCWIGRRKFSLDNCDIGIGFNVLDDITTGSNNCALGVNSGNSLTGADSNNLLILNSGFAGDSGRIRNLELKNPKLFRSNNMWDKENLFKLGAVGVILLAGFIYFSLKNTAEKAALSAQDIPIMKEQKQILRQSSGQAKKPKK